METEAPDRLAQLPARIFMVQAERDASRFAVDAYPDDDSHRLVMVWTNRTGAEEWLRGAESDQIVAEGDLPVAVVSLATVRVASHLLVDAPPQAREELASLAGCFEAQPPMSPIGRGLLPLSFDSGWAAVEFFLSHQWALHPLLLALLTRRKDALPNPQDALAVGHVYRELNAVASFISATPCGKCGEKRWECTSVSPSRTASKWRCTYCDRQRVLQTSEILTIAVEPSPFRLSIPREVQREVWRRDFGRCARCKSQRNLEFDHIIPVAKGGANTARNIQLLCESCNRAKGANPPGDV